MASPKAQVQVKVCTDPAERLVRNNMNPRALLAEFIGTFALCFIGIGSIAAVGNSPNGNLLIPALAFGFVIVAFGSALGPVSGAHFNPCVTVAMLLTRHIKFGAAAAYIIVQIIGAFAGTYAVTYALGSPMMSLISYGIPAPAASVTLTQVVVIETLLTFFLVLVIYGTAVGAYARKSAAMIIGLTVTLDILMGGPLTGASMNFARYLAPAVLSGQMANLWAYSLGGFAGAILAALAARVLFPTEKAEPAS